MSQYQPKPGDRVLVTRFRPGGAVHFKKTGTILEVGGGGFLFQDDEYGRRSLAGNQQVGNMSGWSQTIEPLRGR